MASLGFKALHHGAEKLPDQAFEKIPVVGPRYFREKDRSSRDRRGSDSDSDSDSSYDRDHHSRRSRRSHRRSAPRGERRGDRDRGYDSDQGPKQYSESPYFPPPPRIAVNQPDGSPNGPQGQQGPYMPRPYNPAEYGARPGSRDDYFAGHPQEQLPYVPPPSSAQQQPQPPPSQSGAASDSADPNRHSSIADRYRPANYDARSERGSPVPGYPSALAVRHGSQDYHDYSPPSYDYDSGSDADNRRSRRNRSKSRGSQRSRSRAGSAASKVKDGFGKHKKDLGAGALGAIAGGIIGNVLGGGNSRNRKSKSNITGMMIGAALGGIGAAALENRHEKRKAKKMGEHYDGYESY